MRNSESSYVRPATAAAQVAGVDVHLPAAGLPVGEDHVVPQTLQQADRRLADPRESVSARHVIRVATRTRSP